VAVAGIPAADAASASTVSPPTALWYGSREPRGLGEKAYGDCIRRAVTVTAGSGRRAIDAGACGCEPSRDALATEPRDRVTAASAAPAANSLELRADGGFAFGKEGSSILELALSLEAGNAATPGSSVMEAGGARLDTGTSAALAIIAEVCGEVPHG
jgi:hypothetical protein